MFYKNNHIVRFYENGKKFYFIYFANKPVPESADTIKEAKAIINKQ